MNTIPQFILSNNQTVPAIGLGSCKHDYSKAIDEIVCDAIDAGYRYIDTASYYCTERDIGRAVKKASVPRTDLMIATKLWYEELGYENAKIACKNSLSRLDMDYIDFYLIHWPKSSPDDMHWKEKLLDTWRALTELKTEGLVKNIGVSNFLPHHLQVLLDNFEEKPVVDQLELHLGYFQEYAVRFLLENHIQPQAWSSLGRGMKEFTNNAIITNMAKKYGVSIQKLGLRFLTQRGIMPILWSTSKEHLADNLNIFDFDISDEDISMLSCMPQETWLGEHPDFYLPLGKHLNPNQ